jgi:hypothetical protein
VVWVVECKQQWAESAPGMVCRCEEPCRVTGVSSVGIDMWDGVIRGCNGRHV